MESSLPPRVRKFLASLWSRRLALLLVFSSIMGILTCGAWILGGRYTREIRELDSAPVRIGRNAPFITSPDEVVDEMVAMADLKPGDVAFDLGCGDGRIIITAALKTGCRGVGYDIDPERVAEARQNVELHGVEHLVEIRQQDIFTVDLAEAQVVFMFLLPWMNQKLVPQLEELKPGSRIISHQFNLGDAKELQPERTAMFRVSGDESQHYVHRWTAPLSRRSSGKSTGPRN